MMDVVSLLLTVVGVVANVLSVTGILVSAGTRFRFWPLKERDWRYWLAWGLWYAATGSLLLTGVLDWGSFSLFPFIVRVLGVVGVLGGSGIFLVAIQELGVSETEGLEGELQTGGLYSYTRNPQYVGDIIATAGWIVVTDSLLTLIIGATAVLYYLLLPLAEEPWLYEQYGEEYQAYCQRIPRFVGKKTLMQLIGKK